MVEAVNLGLDAKTRVFLSKNDAEQIGVEKLPAYYCDEAFAYGLQDSSVVKEVYGGIALVPGFEVLFCFMGLTEESCGWALPDSRWTDNELSRVICEHLQCEAEALVNNLLIIRADD